MNFYRNETPEKITATAEIEEETEQTAAEEKTEECIEPDAPETADIEEITIEPEDETVDSVVVLSKKIKFEGKIIDSVDMSGFESLSAEDGEKVMKLYRRIAKNVSVSPETTNEYAMAAAAMTTDLPVELFKKLPLKDIVKIRNRIINFLYSD